MSKRKLSPDYLYLSIAGWIYAMPRRKFFLYYYKDIQRAVVELQAFCIHENTILLLKKS